jgi:general secretion pathway protein A
LSGFLAGKSDFTRADVEEVASELKEETQSVSVVAPNSPGEGSESAVHSPLTESAILDIDLSRLELDPSTAERASRAIAELKSGQADQRMIRIERSIVRLERSNAAVLSLIQQLVDAVRAKQ